MTSAIHVPQFRFALSLIAITSCTALGADLDLILRGGTVYDGTGAEPFVADDVLYFDGFGGQRVYVIPSRRLVIVRTGSSTMSWDDAYLPNLIVRGLVAAASDQA